MTIPSPSNASNPGVREQLLQGQVGRAATSGPLNKIRSMVSAAGSQAQVDTATVSGTITAGTAFGLSIEGVTVSYTTDGAEGSLTAVAGKLAQAINASPNARAIAAAAASGPDVTLTCTVKGAPITVLATTSNVAIASVQAASSPAGVPFGRLVLAAGYLSGVASATESGQLASSAAFSAQEDLLTVGYAAASVYVVEINGTTEGVNANTDGPTTATDIAAAITANPFFAADGISASAAGDVVTVTIAAGGEFGLRVFVTTGAGTLTATSNKGIGTSLARAAAGVSMRQAVEGVIIPGGAALGVMESGDIWVEVDAADMSSITKGGDVYVDLTPGATQGRFYPSAAAGRLLLAGAQWERAANNTNDALAVLRVSIA